MRESKAQAVPNYFTLMQYFSNKGVELTPKQSQDLGMRARKLSEAKDTEVKLLENSKGVKVRNYHKDILEELVKSFEGDPTPTSKARVDVDLYLNSGSNPQEVLNTNMKVLGRIPSKGEHLYIKHTKYRVEDIHTTLEEDLVPCYVEIFLWKADA